MALLSFPSSPVNGQLYPTSPLPGQNQYEWSAAEQTWRLLGTATAVTPGCYGDASNVATFCVDAQGRIISAVNTPITVQNLQNTTDQGSTTTNVIDVAGLVSAGLTYPTVDGATNDVLVTDGAGTLSFAALPTETLQTVTNNGAVTTNTIDVAGLIAASLTYPTVDGIANDVLITDGAGNLSFATPPVVDLQYVTNLGATTTNTIDVAGLIAASLTYPTVDGVANDVLVTDGAGNLSFATPPVVDLQYVTNLGATTTNSVDVAGLTAAGLNYPLADGTATQVVTTDGAGNLGWLTTAEVVAVPAGSASPGAVNQIAFGGGNFYFHDGAQWWQVAGVAF